MLRLLRVDGFPKLLVVIRLHGSLAVEIPRVLLGKKTWGNHMGDQVFVQKKHEKNLGKNLGKHKGNI